MIATPPSIRTRIRLAWELLVDSETPIIPPIQSARDFLNPHVNRDQLRQQYQQKLTELLDAQAYFSTITFGRWIPTKLVNWTAACQNHIDWLGETDTV